MGQKINPYGFRLGVTTDWKSRWFSEREYKEYLTEDSFEALDKRLFLTATDIVNGKLVIFESGPLISAVLASSAIPAVFTPVEIDGHLFADGAVRANILPVGLSGDDRQGRQRRSHGDQAWQGGA